MGLVSVQGQCSGPVFRASVQGQFSGPVFRVSFQGQCSGSVFRVSFQGQCWDSCEGFGSEDFLCAKGLGFVVYLVRRVWGFRVKGLGRWDSREGFRGTNCRFFAESQGSVRFGVVQHSGALDFF